MAQEEQLNDVIIADQATKILRTVDQLTKNPYMQMAALKSAAAIIQNRIEAAGVKAAITMAIAGIANPNQR